MPALATSTCIAARNTSGWSATSWSSSTAISAAEPREHNVMRLLHVVGTRPNFIKMAPVVAAARDRFGAETNVVVHTGQHYDRAMSDVFFEELGVGEPDHMLGVGSAAHGAQTALAIERLEPLLAELRPDLVLVPGDVNSTLAGALAAAKLQIPVGHVEA